MSQDNRDKRVQLLQEYARRFFPNTAFLDYAVRVEAYTCARAFLFALVLVDRGWAQVVARDCHGDSDGVLACTRLLCHSTP